MRPGAALALATVLLAAGCVGSRPPAGTTPASTTTATSTPTGTTTSSTTTPTVTPPPPAPRNASFYAADHDFSHGNPSAPAREPFNVTPGALNLTFRVAFDTTGGLPGGAGLSVAVRLLDPGGGTAATCPASDPCEARIATPPSGAWQVEYSGAGTSVAHVQAWGYVNDKG